MPDSVQGWKLLPPCVTWVPTVSRLLNCWVFLKRHLSSAFVIKKLQLYKLVFAQEIAVLFDPLYHLQCTCNLFLKHNVANVECDITVNGE